MKNDNWNESANVVNSDLHFYKVTKIFKSFCEESIDELNREETGTVRHYVWLSTTIQDKSNVIKPHYDTLKNHHSHVRDSLYISLFNSLFKKVLFEAS